MKIVYFVHCFFPEHFYGSETYTLNVAQYMQNAGHDVHIVTARFPGEAKQQTWRKDYQYESLNVISFDKNIFPNTRIKDTYYQEEMRNPLRELLSELQPDIIHVVHLINHTAVLLEVCKSLHIPVVATFTDFFGFCFNNKLQAADDGLCQGPNNKRDNCLACYFKATSEQQDSAWKKKVTSTQPWLNMIASLAMHVNQWQPSRIPPQYRSMIPDLKHRPDILHACYQHYWAAIAPSKFLESAYLKNGFSKPLYLQNFGVDIDRSPKPVRDDNVLRIGYIGQIAAHKGVDILLQAFTDIQHSQLHIYGPEDQDRAYTEQLRHYADACVSEVIFHGTFKPDRMADIFRELDVLVIPSTWYENSPLVLLYALATHTPAIVSDVEGMTEFVRHGENGFVFPMGDVKGLEKILLQLSTSQHDAKKMSLNTNYPRTTEDMAKDVLHIYKKKLGLPK